ncbi:uncharacterized protein LOC107265174 isoform X2 [Cephus cinctus]|uniref:Uncharacterized protein LOC107265174 isoform X2 n=1 Tax=Cephus cinctus TaxID=211228 RepID=A0AAJ7FFW7_CEPCN|nr:uncharacterized protein LOC107265174 isoform X2 [Cephus cinctus]
MAETARSGVNERRAPNDAGSSPAWVKQRTRPRARLASRTGVLHGKMSSLDYLDLCRLCLVKDRVSVPIFEGEGDVRQIFLKIAACLPVKVAREDKLPKKICDDCVYKVELFYQFWNTTANAEKQLLQWLGEVGLEEKQGYVTGVLNPSVMKQEQNSESRLDSNVMQQVSGHQDNMGGMTMIDNMGLGMPIMIPSGNQQQITSVPMDTSGNSVQTVRPVQQAVVAVAGPSAQPNHQEQLAQNQGSASATAGTGTNPTTATPTVVTASISHQDDEEDTTDEDENSDEECDADEGLPVKEESEEDPSNNRTIEPTTFVNVSLACDEAGPSGLQQQKITEMPEMSMPQAADGDPKSGYAMPYNDAEVEADADADADADTGRGIFIFHRESVVMRKWQILEFDGKPYYAFVPENDTPLEEEAIPELFEQEEDDELESKSKIAKVECVYGDESADNGSYDGRYYEEDHDFLNGGSLEANDDDALDVKPVLINGVTGKDDFEDKSGIGNLYQVKVQGSMVTIERFAANILGSRSSEQDQLQGRIQTYQAQPEDEQIEMHLPEEQEEQEEAEEEESKQEHPEIDHDQNKGQAMGFEFIEQDQSFRFGRMSLARLGVRGAKARVGRALKCKVCSETFGSAVAFRKHVAWTHKKKVCIQEDGAYICAVCDYRTLKKSLFAAHLERKHETWSRKRSSSVMFPCGACGFVCRTKHSLQSHFIRKHTDKYEHQCKFCAKKFKVKGDLTNHVRFHHKEKPVNCDVCGKLCLNSSSLYVHQKWAHYKPKYECHICKRRMVTQENLDQHLVTQHEKREKIVCAECGKTFTKKDSFNRHMSVHTGSKPHACLICSKPFARRSQLRQHLLIHTGKRPFVCDICGKAFTQKPGLICHRKTHPGPHPPLPVMPIGDIVKEFTEGFIQECNSAHQESQE